MPDYDLDPFEPEAAEPAPEAVRFPLWDPEDNQSPFPDDVWAGLAHDHNHEQRQLLQLYALLTGDLHDQGVPC